MKIKVGFLLLLLIPAYSFGYLPKGEYNAGIGCRGRSICGGCSFDGATQTLNCSCWDPKQQCWDEGELFNDCSAKSCLLFMRIGQGGSTNLGCDDSYKQAGDAKAQAAYLIKKGFGPEDFIMLYPTIIARGFKSENFTPLISLAIRQSNSVEMLKKLAEKGLTVTAADYEQAMDEAQALDKTDVIDYLRQQRAK